MHILVSGTVKNTAVLLRSICLEWKQVICNSTVENRHGVTLTLPSLDICFLHFTSLNFSLLTSSLPSILQSLTIRGKLLVLVKSFPPGVSGVSKKSN